LNGGRAGSCFTGTQELDVEGIPWLGGADRFAENSESGQGTAVHREQDVVVLHARLPGGFSHELKDGAAFIVIRRERECGDLEMEIVWEGIHSRANLICRCKCEEKRKADVLKDRRILCAHVQRLNQPQSVVCKVALLERGGKIFAGGKGLWLERGC